jgi:EXLDI family protein
MPNKTIYVSDEDMPLFQRAQELAGGNLSAAISAAILRFVDIEEGRQAGFEEITVKVGVGAGRKVRFSGVLLGEWGRTTSSLVVVYRLYRTRTGKFAVHTERSAEWTTGDDDKWSTGWRGWVGNWSPNQTWSYTKGEATLRVAETRDELKDLVPPDLYEAVATAADQPDIEDLDI